MHDGFLPGLSAEDAGPYRVLARKYRPTGFEELIGQDALVRTLSNAIAAGRIAQAFILTGVRGVGKTTTARIIARALNCIGADGTGGPTVTPCGVCQNCTAIADDRHVDVVELDAASNNGIDNVREIIEQVRYRPVMARYKVYIFDEVHMLSTAAFNGLLKTLEEPPPHVKFIFATTEIRKVPVTVLSRCQRFDLRRVDSTTLVRHFAKVAAAEGAEVEPDALALIARAADGSVRDGLSLLDQAIARVGAGSVSAEQVRDMLGLADRVRVFDLLEALLRGDAAGALETFGDMHRSGADPLVVVQDLMDLVHWLTRARVSPATAAEDATVAEAERRRGRALAETLGMPVLTRFWQMLLKGVGEAQHAPMPKLAVDMLMVRLAYAAELPSPAELIERLSGGGPGGGGGGGGTGGGTGAAVSGGGGSPAVAAPSGGRGTAMAAAAVHAPQMSGPTMSRGGTEGGAAIAMPQPPEPEPLEPEPLAPPAPNLSTLAALAAYLAERREAMLHTALMHDVHAITYRPGYLEFRPAERAGIGLAQELRRRLPELTGMPWQIVVSQHAGKPTLAEAAAERKDRMREQAIAHPLVQAALAAFPGARVEAVREIARAAGDDADAATDDGEPVGDGPAEDDSDR